MAWLIGILCIVIVIFFWRIFVPLGILAGIVIGLLLYMEKVDREKSKEEEIKKEAALRKKISTAKANATSKGKNWKLNFETDPASGRKVARSAYVISNDGLCNLRVEKRIDKSKLTDLHCPDFVISEYDDIEVKFDNHNTSDRMDIKKYKDSSGIYIPSYQFYSLSYDEFIKRLKTGKTVAIKIPSAGGVWVAFTLKGAAKTIGMIGSSLVPSEK